MYPMHSGGNCGSYQSNDRFLTSVYSNGVEKKKYEK